MTEQTPGLELFLSSEKAVQGAAKFRDAVESAAQAVERIGAVVDRLDGLLDRLGASAKSAAPALTKLGDSASKVGTSFGESGAQAQRYESRLGRLGVTAGGVARQLTFMLGAAGAISGIAGAVAAFSDYEDKLRILGSIAGATGAQLQKLEAASVDLSRNSRFTPREALQGLTELSRAGLSAEDSIKALQPTADLARVGLLGLGDSSAIVTKTLTQFALGADQASRVADVLAKAANISNADVGTLADSLAKTGPVARQFGVSLEDTVAALARLADNGLAANIAGTGLQRVLIQLRSPTEEAQRALLGLGLTAEKINPEKVGLTGALQNLRDAGLSVQDSVSLVGTEFASLLTILTGSVGSIEQVGETLRSSTGEAAKQAAAGADTLAAAFADLRGASEQFAVSASRGGIGQALTDITRTGAEVLRVLAGDTEAMEKASTAAKLLATSLQLAVVAGSVFAAVKIALPIQNIAKKLEEATRATILFDAATGTSVGSVGRASKALGQLWLIIRSNPLVAVASAVAAIASAFVVFGDSASRTSEKVETFKASLEDARRVASQFDEIRLQVLAGNARAAESLERGLREQLVRISELGKRGSKSVPALDVLGAIEQLAPEAIIRARKLTDELTKLFEAGATPNAAVDLRIQKVRKELKELTGLDLKEVLQNIPATVLQSQKLLVAGFEVETSNAVNVLSEALNKAANNSNAAREALEGAAAAAAKLRGDKGQDPVSGAVSGLIAERERELKLAQLIGEERLKQQLLDEARKRNGGTLNEDEQKLVITASERLFKEQQIAEQKQRQAKEAEKLAEQQRDLPKNLAALQKQYADELATSQATGLQRELIRAAVEAENDAKAIGLALTSEEFAALKKNAEERARLAFEERQQKKETRVDRRQNEALRQLAQEEQLLRLSGAERERYRLLIEAENEARQAGLVLGTAEYQDFIRRKTEVRELAAVQEQLAQAAGQFAASWTSALEQFIIDGGKARDVARALWQDLQRLAFRQTAGAGLNSLFQSGAAALAGLLGGGGGTTQNGLPVAPGASLPDLNGLMGYNPLGPTQNRLLGGLIPAMNGVVIDRPSYLQRGANTYGVAEGGETTPEAVFRLAKDQSGQLGVRAVGGGGGDRITMNFPAVRTAQDARATRATMGQQWRALKAGDRKGRRGRRPAGE